MSRLASIINVFKCLENGREITLINYSSHTKKAFFLKKKKKKLSTIINMIIVRGFWSFSLCEGGPNILTENIWSIQKASSHLSSFAFENFKFF